MQRSRAILATLGLLPALLAAPPSASGVEGLEDVRRPLIPLATPSAEAYAKCYPPVAGDTSLLGEGWKETRALQRVRKGISRFDYTAPDGWDLALRIDQAIKALRKNPRDALAAEQLGIWLTLQHEFAGAIESFESAARLADELSERVGQPETVADCLGGPGGRIRVNLANTALLAGDIELARRSLSEVGGARNLSAPARLRWHWLRAEVAALGGDLDAALEELDQAAAVELSEEARSRFPLLASETWREAAQAYFRATVAYRAEEWERAVALFGTAADGGLLDAEIGRARALAQLGRFGDAIERLDTVNRAHPLGSMMRPEIVAYDLGNLRTATGDRAGARTDFQQALYTVVERSCDFLQGADTYFDRYCDLEAPCRRLKAMPVSTPCQQYLSCRDFSKKEPDEWWAHTLCRSLEPDIFVAAHNNFAMSLAEDPATAGNPATKEIVERHLQLAIDGARGAPAARIPQLNLARTRWDRGETEDAVAALFDLVDDGGEPRVAARSLWSWLDLPRAGADELPAIEAFVQLADRSRLHGSSTFRRELDVVETVLTDLLQAGEVDPVARRRAHDLLASLALSTTARTPSWGPIDAPVTIVEFSDFECPSCARDQPALEAVREAYGDRVRIAFRATGNRTSKASEAALCAADQGKFWELHDLLFADRGDLTVADLKTKARSIDDLDPTAFDACLDSDAKAREVAADVDAGAALGVTGTPALFVNGKLVPATVDTTELLKIVKNELEVAADRRGVEGDQNDPGG